ncbi:hypothetical protein VitviT2T_005601 [Vitis vinifera]|uniref:RNase H type-1 domain-containing protein n=1 Tax=Vitis vinifera TaxID=29760 RepID=A0ABY9BTN2_VITVI|nr:hypothetical protein VitviT2T_005601 [Vitis vinifera]
MGFSSKWLEWMRMCVCTVSYKVVFGGELLGPIYPTRGLRQRDPLSPYLFILATEGLSTLLKQGERCGVLHGCSVARGAPTVSHLFFANDSYLFFKATESESRSLKQILLQYQNLSGQEINLNKSALTFSRNTDDVVKRGICSILQVEEQANPDLCRDIESMMNDFFWDSNPQRRSIIWMSWGKMCWRFLRNPDSLVTRNFQARYFRNSSFLNAELGSNPSYMWRSILAAQDLLKRGCYWSIASGTKVQVWGDSWLPDSSNRLIITPPIAGFDGIKVDELIIEGLWREDFIRDKFMARDADLILSIPLPMSSREDQISWSFDARGEYTARSGYGALRCFRQSAALVASDVDSNFVWAQSEPETTLHALVECVAARDVWDESGLAMLQGNFGSFVDWLATMFAYCDSVVFAKYLAVCWGLWWRRNDVVWNGRIRHSQQKPDYGWIKINVDEAVFLDEGAIGAVFQDHQGRFMGGFAKPFPHQTLSEVVEALGVREVLSWIHERSRSRIVVETDCLRVVQAIQHKSCPNTSFGFTIADCLDVLQHLVDVQVVYARRSANSAAHCLAKGAGPLVMQLGSLTPWIEKSENVADISSKYRLSGGMETINGTDYRSTEKLAKNRQNRRYIGEISVKHRKIGEKSRYFLPVQPAQLCFSAWLKNRGFRNPLCSVVSVLLVAAGILLI